jgi:hypothetical protein
VIHSDVCFCSAGGVSDCNQEGLEKEALHTFFVSADCSISRWRSEVFSYCSSSFLCYLNVMAHTL